jgi:hypothetical protein
MKKTIRLGRGEYGDIFCRIEIEGDRLSVTGVEGPKRNGDALGSAGQIIMSFKEYDARGHAELSSIKPAPGWDAALIRRFFDTWDRWHMNDMKAGCEHQRAAGWDQRPIDPSKPTTAYGKHFLGQRQDSWNLLGWVRQDEHPEGLMCRPCPTCGYKYGTAWLREELPAEVVEFLRSLPDADQEPAWV